MERIRQALHQLSEKTLAPVARLFVRIGVTPTQATVTGVLLNVVVAGLIVTGDLTLAGVLYLAAGVFDMLDGTLARLTGRASSFGAFLDSTLDRVSEGVVLAAVTYHCAAAGHAVDATVAVLALLGSLLISYTRARAEALGAECRVGIVTRAERVALLSAGLVFPILAEAVYLLCLLAAITAAQRMLHVLRRLRSPG